MIVKITRYGTGMRVQNKTGSINYVTKMNPGVERRLRVVPFGYYKARCREDGSHEILRRVKDESW